MKTLIATTGLQLMVAATILGVLAFGCGAVCVAGDRSDVPHTVVKFGDVNLSSPGGAATLYSRIVAAGYEVCRSFDTDGRYLLDLIGLDVCVHSAVRNAAAKINHPALSAVYNARNHDPLPITLATARNR